MHFYTNHQAQINRDLATSQKLVREQAEQQQIVVRNLEKQITLLAKPVDGLQAKARSKAEYFLLSFRPKS